MARNEEDKLKAVVDGLVTDCSKAMFATICGYMRQAECEFGFEPNKVDSNAVFDKLVEELRVHWYG